MAKRPLKLVRLEPPAGDTDIADMLLFVLRGVRAGRVKALSVSLVVEEPDGAQAAFAEASADGDEFLELQLLGCMRAAEHGLIERRREREGED